MEPKKLLISSVIKLLDIDVFFTGCKESVFFSFVKTFLGIIER